MVSLVGCVAQRPEDPVVLNADQVPRLLGAQPGKVLAFRYLTDRWDQVPVQVDERALVDLAKPKNAAPTGKTFLTYTDPATFTGPDPDPTVDANDEIAMMGIDSGLEAPAGSAPPNTVVGSGTKVRLVDSVGDATPSYLYLFRQTGNLDPGAGRRYVDYRFQLLSGDYKTTYKLGAGPNPENSTVSTPYYSQHFSDRWVDDQLRITMPGAGGQDILDRHKNLFAPGNCGRSEDTFSAGAGAMIANKSGPVRAIRSYIGANSGTYTQREHIFYERRHDITTYLRVHAIPGVMDFFDYAPAAIGMTYKSDVDPRGVRIDGVPDSPTPGALGWESCGRPSGCAGHSAHQRHRRTRSRRLHLVLPGQAGPGRWSRDAVHGRRLGLRRERPTAGAGNTQHRPDHRHGKPADGVTTAVLRVTRQDRRREGPRAGAQPAADHHLELALERPGPRWPTRSCSSRPGTRRPRSRTCWRRPAVSCPRRTCW